VEVHQQRGQTRDDRAALRPMTYAGPSGRAVWVAGMPLPQLQMIMGHHSPTVTMRYYVHVAEADIRRALDCVELGLGKKGDRV
jgi:integrase